MEAFKEGRLYQTIVVSDLHLADAEPLDPERPLWKLFKRRELFFDQEFIRCVEHIEEQYDGNTELILNGDIFDFDCITQLPEEPPAEIDWLARLRGLGTEEWMSAFKMQCILEDHAAWFEWLGEFVRRGNKLVFVIGNHDLELSWPSVQASIRASMGLEEDSDAGDGVVFCSWFYVSEGDTYISHGHQYDPYCVVRDPVHPFIQIKGRSQVRLPFGELAERYMLNGMGYFNPHATSNFIMELKDYVTFFFKYMLRRQPLLVWTWFWGALTTLFLTLTHFVRPVLRDPLEVEKRTREVADDANVTPEVVRQLHAVSTPSACANPLRLVRELWLDRALLFLGMLYLGFQFFAAANLVAPLSAWWGLVPVLLLAPLFFSYSYSVTSAMFNMTLLSVQQARLIAKITGCRRIVLGHSHEPEVRQLGETTYLNSGFWSPAYAEPECINRLGEPTFVWIKGDHDGGRRSAELLGWPPGAREPQRLNF